ncbi:MULTISPECIES: hypothetical protein [Streptomyces]|uniref:hypothetical protein n=1 Tax=Streptomyces TaxID=1883 RepID=UPI0004CDDB93|nr:hypothetical protein [Streptomyces durhamensis]
MSVMTAAPRAALSAAAVSALLGNFTPVDAGVLADLPAETVEEHARDLLKRLHVAAEITAPGRGAALIEEVLAADPDEERLLDCLDAILEFGRLPEDLSADEAEKAARAEIRQEVLHFDRIMDLESLREGRITIKARRDLLHGGTLGAAERLLVLLQERLMMRGARPLHWQDLSSVEQKLVSASGDGARLERSQYPVAVACAAGADSAQAADVLAALERNLVRHPMPVSLGLLDYAAFVEGAAPASVIASTLHLTEDGEVLADIWAAGSGSWAVLTRDGFRQRVVDQGTLQAQSLGQDRTRLAHATVTMPEGAWLLLTTEPGIGALANLADELNRPGRTGRVDLGSSLGRLCGDAPYALGKSGALTRLAQPTSRDYDDTLREFAGSLLDGASGLHLSIECGHVHADREMGPAQLRGLDLGARFVELLGDAAERAATPLSVDVAAMVDDDHVLNRFAFGRYRELFAERNIPVDDLILESSPLPRAVAHDVLRRALQRDGQGYRLNQVGGNLYLEAPDLRLELIEDLHGEMRNGCVLFEVGLVMYRAARRQLTDVFWQETGAERDDLHGRMAAAYDAAPDPLTREQLRTGFERMYDDPWTKVVDEPGRTPFLDAYTEVLTERFQRGETTAVFNVIEDYYRPQQEKVVRLAELLDIPLPLHALFFGPYSRGVERLAAGTGCAPCN